MNKLFLALANTFMICLPVFNSCTISDPDQPSDNNNPRLLSEITAANMRLAYFNYDSKGRLTEYASPEINERIEISYDPLTITIFEYDEYCDNNDKYTQYMSSKLEMTNIKLNDAGCVSSYNNKETTWSTRNNYNEITGETTTEIVQNTPEIWSSNVSYNEKGHLTTITNNDGDTDGIYNWDGDLLTSTKTDDDYIYTYEYLTTPNKFAEWIPLTMEASPLLMTGLFGPGPSRLISKVLENGKMMTEIGYRLYSNGQVAQIKYYDYGENIIATFIYK